MTAASDTLSCAQYPLFRVAPKCSTRTRFARWWNSLSLSLSLESKDEGEETRGIMVRQSLRVELMLRRFMDRSEGFPCREAQLCNSARPCMARQDDAMTEKTLRLLQYQIPIFANFCGQLREILFIHLPEGDVDVGEEEVVQRGKDCSAPP